MTTSAIRSFAAPALALLLATAGPARAGDGGELPAEECVRQMRSARVARMSGDEAAELAKLQAAAEACPREIAPIHALMSYHRRHAQNAASHLELLGQLQQRLRTPGNELSAGVIEYLIRNPDAEDAELVAILDNVSRQVDGAEAPDPQLTRIQAQLQLRLDRYDGAIETIERLRRIADSEDLVRTLYPSTSDSTAGRTPPGCSSR